MRVIKQRSFPCTHWSLCLWKSQPHHTQQGGLNSFFIFNQARVWYKSAGFVATCATVPSQSLPQLPEGLSTAQASRVGWGTKLAQPQPIPTSTSEDPTQFSCSKPDRRMKITERIQRASVNISFGNVSFHANLFSCFQQKFHLNRFDRDFEGCIETKFFIRFALKNVKIRYRIKVGCSSGWVCCWQGGQNRWSPQLLLAWAFPCFHANYFKTLSNILSGRAFSKNTLFINS